jgi:hypothetical protein
MRTPPARLCNAGRGDADSLDMPAEHEHHFKAAPEVDEW